jgi:hypothetical protein
MLLSVLAVVFGMRPTKESGRATADRVYNAVKDEIEKQAPAQGG